MNHQPSYEDLEKRVRELESAESERIRAEAALKVGCDRFERTCRMGNIGGWEFDAVTGEGSWTGETARIHDLDPAFPITRDLGFQYYTDDSREKITAAVKDAVERGVPYDLELEIISAKGIRKWVQTIGQPATENGKVVRVVGILRDITDRKIRENYNRMLIELLDAVPGCVLIHDLEGRLLYANRTAHEIHGHEKADFMKLTLPELTDPESKMRMPERLKTLAEKGKASFTVKHLRKGGHPIPLQVDARMADWDGRPAVLSVSMDISERLQAEMALKLSHERLEEAQKLAKIGPWEANLATGQVFWSQPVFDIFGQDPRTFIPSGDSFAALLHPEDRSRVSESVSQLAANGIMDVIYRVHRPDGETRFVRELAKLHPDDQGNFLLLRGTVQDITDQKLAEEAIRETEERFKILIESAPEGIFLHSEGIFQYLNPTMLALLGVAKAEDLMGTPILDRVAPEYHENARSRIRLQTESGQIIPVIEEEFLRLDGTRIPVEVTGVAIQFRGKAQRVVFVRDITPRRKAEADRQQLQTQLQQIQKMESIGQLAGGVAHDYNNMLSVILGFTDLALEKEKSGEPVQGNLLKIKAAAERSADITRQLLAFARKQTIAPKIVDLNHMVDEMLAMLRRLIGEDIDLVWLPRQNPGLVNMDPSQVDQIIANLCINARDAVGGVGTVTLETRQVTFDDFYCATHAECLPGKFVMLAVSDDGCGMDRETATRIFEPFFTTKELGRGTGLGLATVYGIVKQNNGFIHVYSEPGKGSTFKVYLPEHRGAAADEISPGHTGIPMGKGELILAVEDDPEILELIQTMLISIGYTPLTTDTPSDALRLAESHSNKIALLISDVVMPGINGRELAERVRVHCPGLRTLFISGYTANVIAHRGVLDDGVTFLQKPFSREALAVKLREMLAAGALPPGPGTMRRFEAPICEPGAAIPP